MTGVEQADWEDSEFATALEPLRHKGVIDAVRRQISSLQVARIMDAAPRVPDERRMFKKATFDGATFQGDASFVGATFQGDASFDGATFRGDAHFDKAIFEGEAHFRKATFTGDAHFPEAEFRSVDFSEATFERAAHFPGATIDGDARFREASLKEAFVIGPMLVRGVLVLDGASFSGIEIRASADRLLCQRTQFHGPANLRIRWAEVALDGAVFESASLLGSSEAFDALHKHERDQPAHPLLARLTEVGKLERDWRKDSFGRGEKPRLVSLRGGNVGNLVVSDVDLGACLFAGAANLDGLRIEGSPTFPPAPRWTRSEGSWRFARRWSPRMTVAEEHHWRAQHGHGPRWYEGEVRAPDWLAETSKAPEPQQIAGIYRALRKGREDNKDEPGAADFYYGEMEMRRHAGKARRRIRRIPGIEEAVLWLYWLVSGYGLRASRALAALAITVVVGAVLLDQIGFDADERPEAGPLLFAVESSISLLRAPDTDILTTGGNVVQIALRLAGPLFFGLALLSLRGRVKR
jgi:uncharacterized protein YjbI with pentapeptide repeats